MRATYTPCDTAAALAHAIQGRFNIPGAFPVTITWARSSFVKNGLILVPVSGGALSGGAMLLRK